MKGSSQLRCNSKSCHRAFALAGASALVAAHPTLAQDTPQAAPAQSSAESGTVIYDQAYFSQYGLTNAEDMLNRIPGVSAIIAKLGSASQERGFGSGGDQILVNGRRFPGKANDIAKTLARLRADQVERIELIRGNSSDIDVQSTGIVVNIVLREGASLGGGGTFEANLRGNDEGALGVDGLVNYAGSTGRLAYNFGVERNLWSPPEGAGARWTNRFRDETYFFPDGAVLELRPQSWDRLHNKWIVTGGASYDFDGGTRLQLNGLYQRLHVREFDRTPFTRFNQAGQIVLTATDERTREIDVSEIFEGSGELTAPLWGGSLTALIIASTRSQPTEDSRQRIVGDQTFQLNRTLFEPDRTEYISRIEFARPLSNEVDVTVGAEGSNTQLVQDAAAAFDLNGDGILEQIPIPTSNARVEEWRGEGFVDLSWSPSTALSVNASLNYEYSDLRSNSVFNPGRSLSFLKPRLDVRYNLTSSSQVRLLAERKISQLDFANFVPRYNVLDNRIDAGNPGLLPEDTLNFELGFEHRLAGDAGVIEGKVFYQDIGNAIDMIPLSQGPVTVSAQGNLGDAWLYGAETKASIRLVPIGLRDAVVSLRGRLQNSQVTDPFTGEERRLRADNRYEFDVGFRHDVRALGLSYGADYRNKGDYVIESDLFSRDIYRIGPLLAAFTEVRLTGDLALRLEAQNLLGGHEYRRRNIFLINQIDGRIARRESFNEFRDLRYAVKLRGSF